MTANRKRWVSTMLTEEYGLPREVRSPWIAALSTFTAFLSCGLVPLVPYLLSLSKSLVVSFIMTSIVFFAIGSAKSKWSPASWWSSGLTTLLVGTSAAALAYAAAVVLKGLIN